MSSSFFSSLFKSFSHAWRGICLAFRTERSFRLQVGAGCLVALLGLMLPLLTWERVLLLLAIAMVIVLELVNSMVERLADLMKPRLHEYVADIKDLMAGAVLVAAFFAAVIGALILIPHLTRLAAYL